jgi:hypothetical protein
MWASPRSATSLGWRILVWVEGPYLAGAWNDIIFLTVFYCTAWSQASASRPTMATWGKPIRLPNNKCNPAENLGMESAVRSCHKTLNGCLKNWGILEKVYRHKITVHGMLFYTCVVITQLAIANGEPRFEVEYGDE